MHTHILRTHPSHLRTAPATHVPCWSVLDSCVGTYVVCCVCVYVPCQVRKDILIATRHLLGMDLKIDFMTHLDTFLDESVLIGSVSADTDGMRSLAMSTLADMLHYIRDRISPQQIGMIVHMFARNVHDPTLTLQIQVRGLPVCTHTSITAFTPYPSPAHVNFVTPCICCVPGCVHAVECLLCSHVCVTMCICCVCHVCVFAVNTCGNAYVLACVCVCLVCHCCVQTTSVRLLLNLVSTIYKSALPSPPAEATMSVATSRSLLARMHTTLVHKFETLQHLIPQIITATAAERGERVHSRTVEANTRASLITDTPTDRGATPQPDRDPLLIDDSAALLKTAGSMKDVKSLLRTLTQGLKTVMWCLTNLKPSVDLIDVSRSAPDSAPPRESL